MRVLIGIGIAIYLPWNVEHSSDWLFTSGVYVIVIAAFMMAAFVIVACILLWPQPSPTRRIAANVLDIVTLTFIMVGGNDHTAPLYFIYLWVTFGCGFRYGGNYLLISMTLSSMGFVTVLWVSDYWSRNTALGLGLLLGMILLSLYVFTLVNRLYDALNRAAAANQAKRKFVSSVSHELRTPLNAIIGMNDLLRTTPLNAEQSEMASTMHSASRVMLSLIEDVLDFSKIEAGKVSIESLDFDLHSLVQSTLTIFSRQAALKGLKLGVFVMPDVTHTLTGDAHHLQQILVNLIGNAVKFTQEGEVQLAVSVLTENQRSVRLRFAVRDTGIGIPESDQARIFDSFVQAKSPSARTHRGTGLGTTIAKQLVELMGGNIGLESALGAGSTFWFDLPFAKQSVAPAENVAHFKGSRTLLVGFPESDKDSLEIALQQWQMESSTATDFSIATARLNEARALAKPYQIALMYVDNLEVDFTSAARGLRSLHGDSLALILCAPRDLALKLGMPAEFCSVIGLPCEKRLLYNALHSVLATEETASGIVSLADYYQRKEPTKSYNILVADDDQINRKVIAKQLEIAGHTTTLVGDGEEALDALEESNYDVVILDSNMPIMTGIEATRLIRVMQAGRAAVPIILFSADATPEAIQEAIDAGVNAFLAKPIEATKLYATIEQLIARRSKEAPTRVQPLPQTKLNQPKPSQPPLLSADTLHDLERMSQDPQFVEQLVTLFQEDSSQILAKIEDTLLHHRREEFKAHIHALKGSALNLGAQRLFAHCSRIGALNYHELDASAEALAVEIRNVITETQAALSDYVKNRIAARP